MTTTTRPDEFLSAETRDFYRDAMTVFNRAGVPFLVGGAYALQRYTGIERHTKDFDVFVRAEDSGAALDALRDAGFATELTFPHWLGKAYQGDNFVDVIFSSGNGVGRVDDEWFANAVDGEVLGMAARLCPVEEVIWQKAFIQERERFDGADIMHLIHARSDDLDWSRLLRRFGSHWRVLLGHLVVFGYVYPGERHRVPEWVMNDLLVRLQGEVGASTQTGHLCQGTLLSREQYLIDIERWGYDDARREPKGPMTDDAIDHWTRAIQEHPSPAPK